MSTNAAPSTYEILQAKSAELFNLLKPHRTSDVMQRINLYSLERTGKKLPDYVNGSETPFASRIGLVDDLLEIAKDHQWSKLPEVPKGQAGGKPETKPAAPAATPKPKPAPAPDPELESNGYATTPLSVPSEAAAVVSAPDEPDPMQVIAAQLARLQQPKGKQLTESDVRRIVRTELASIFISIAEVLQK